MIGRARCKCQKAVITSGLAVFGSVLFIALETSADETRKTTAQQEQNPPAPQTEPSSQSEPVPQAAPAPQNPPKTPNVPRTQSETTPNGAKTPSKAEKPLPIRERAWRDLQDGLKENATDKRAKAVNALALLAGNPEAENDAIEALSDEKESVRMAAAGALGNMHCVRAIPQLVNVLDDDEPGVVLAAANSLMLMKDSRAYDVYYGVLTGNTRANKGFVKEQLKPFHDPKKVAALGIEEGIGFVPFGGIGYEVVKRMMKSANDSSLVRAAAAKKLAHDPSAASAEALVDATQDKSWIVRAAAFDAIAQRGDKSLVPEISGSLKDSRDDVRYMAAACIVHLKDIGVKRRPPAKSAESIPLPAKVEMAQSAHR